MNKKIDFFERGQDLIEYAIIFPILFMVLVGIFSILSTAALFKITKDLKKTT